MRITVWEWPFSNKPAFDDQPMPVVNAVNIFDHKDGECVGYVRDDEGHVYFALQLGRSVIAFEHIPENSPATGVLFYKRRKDWISAIKGIDWIVKGLQAASIRYGRDCPKELSELATS